MIDRALPPIARHAFVWAGICAVAFIVLAVLVSAGQLTSADTHGIVALRSHASPTRTTVMLTASFIAHGRLAIPLALLLAALIYRFDSPRDAALYAIACLSGEGVQLALKALVHHRRPVGVSPKLTDAGWYSFPSGHATMAIVVFGLGAFLLTRRAPMAARAGPLILAGTLIILVALSRVYLGAHWPSDVIGSMFAGTGWAAFCLGWAARRDGGGTMSPDPRSSEPV